MTVFLALLHIIAQTFPVYPTFQILSAGSVKSLTYLPVFVSNSLTLPSFPPVTRKFSSNWRVVTDESWAATRWRIE